MIFVCFFCGGDSSAAIISLAPTLWAVLRWFSWWKSNHRPHFSTYCSATLPFL